MDDVENAPLHAFSNLRFICLTCLIVMTFALSGCPQTGYTPKPRGYFRLEFPEKTYQTYESDCPFSFRIPAYALIAPDSTKDTPSCWIDVAFPDFNARIHLSYWPVTSQNMLYELVEDSRELAFKHTVKATAIDERLIIQPERDTYGIVYDIKGNTASSLQFFLTDSTSHYLRGALYFHEEPRIDSIRPVLEFLREDIDTLLNSLRWKG